MIHVTRESKLPSELGLRKIRKIAQSVFSAIRLNGDATLVFTTDKKIRSLNRQYRNVDKVTDVLSFSSNELDPQSKITYIGDVIISIERASLQSAQAKRPLTEELTMLIVHGCLHLGGFDHVEEKELKIMQTKQELLLQELGVSNFSWPVE